MIQRILKGDRWSLLINKIKCFDGKSFSAELSKGLSACQQTVVLMPATLSLCQPQPLGSTAETGNQAAHFQPLLAKCTYERQT